MCYEESFFRLWKRKDERREKIETLVERPAPKQPERPAAVPASASAPKRKETEREAEVV